MRGDSGNSLTGLYICSAIAIVMLVLKLSVIDTWSWWLSHTYRLPISRRERMGTKPRFLNPTNSTLTTWRPCYFSVSPATTWFVGSTAVRYPTGSGFSQVRMRYSPCSGFLAG